MSTIDPARDYVGTTPVSGAVQFALLVGEGLRPESHLLEYGCGTLHLAKLACTYLDDHHYCALEPNRWLVDAALDNDARLDQLVDLSGAYIVQGDDFDARVFVQQFDFVFAHSVLSHAAGWQLAQFFHHAVEVLAVGGRIVASLRLGPDTNADAWTYPSVTWFSRETVQREADAAGLHAVVMPSMRDYYSSLCPGEIHDWVVAWRR